MCRNIVKPSAIVCSYHHVALHLGSFNQILFLHLGRSAPAGSQRVFFLKADSTNGKTFWEINVLGSSPPVSLVSTGLVR